MFLFEQNSCSMIEHVHFNFHNRPDTNICTLVADVQVNHRPCISVLRGIDSLR